MSRETETFCTPANNMQISELKSGALYYQKPTLSVSSVIQSASVFVNWQQKTKFYSRQVTKNHAGGLPQQEVRSAKVLKRTGLLNSSPVLNRHLAQSRQTALRAMWIVVIKGRYKPRQRNICNQNCFLVRHGISLWKQTRHDSIELINIQRDNCRQNNEPLFRTDWFRSRLQYNGGKLYNSAKGFSTKFTICNTVWVVGVVFCHATSCRHTLMDWACSLHDATTSRFSERGKYRHRAITKNKATFSSTEWPQLCQTSFLWTIPVVDGLM